jgi:hypothetical protein
MKDKRDLVFAACVIDCILLDIFKNRQDNYLLCVIATSLILMLLNMFIISSNETEIKEWMFMLFNTSLGLDKVSLALLIKSCIL